jgi:hypothetical protein
MDGQHSHRASTSFNETGARFFLPVGSANHMPLRSLGLRKRTIYATIWKERGCAVWPHRLLIVALCADRMQSAIVRGFSRRVVIFND